MIRRVTEEFVHGAVSFVREKGFLQPCRLAIDKRHWLPKPKCETLWEKAFCGSGVRVRIETDAREVVLEFAPLDTPNPNVPHAHAFDAVVDNQIVQVVQCGEGATEAVFDQIGEGLRTLEIWLPPTAIVSLNRLRTTKATVLRPAPDARLRWVTWGSSLTQCNYAGSAARVWPATVARNRNLHLTSLGFARKSHDFRYSSAGHVAARVSVWTQRARPRVENLTISVTAPQRHVTARVSVWTGASAPSRRKSHDFRYSSAMTRNRTRERVDPAERALPSKISRFPLQARNDT
jgi:hypothetical protein